MEMSAGVHKRGSIQLSDIIEAAKAKSGFYKSGAIALFVGVVRGETRGHERVKKLELEAYEEKADEVLTGICEDLKEREGIVDVQIHHFIGEFGVGEDLVYVLVAGAHRSEVFPTLREAVERYKGEVPIFKKEYTVTEDGLAKSHWVEEKRK